MRVYLIGGLVTLMFLGVTKMIFDPPHHHHDWNDQYGRHYKYDW